MMGHDASRCWLAAIYTALLLASSMANRELLNSSDTTFCQLWIAIDCAKIPAQCYWRTQDAAMRRGCQPKISIILAPLASAYHVSSFRRDGACSTLYNAGDGTK